MALSLYDTVVPPYRQILGSVQGVLAKGAEHCKAQGVSPDTLLGERIHADMLPLTFQLRSVLHHSVGALRGVKAGEFGPPSGNEELDYAGFQAKLAEATEELSNIDAAEFNAMEGKDVTFKLTSMSLPFTAEGFLMSFSKPNVYFHATTAYDILRMKGVPLGKRDFLGQMQMKMG